MAKLGWIGSVGLAVGAAAGTAAAQFGLGYGLGIISWHPTTTDPITTDSIWLASLAWTTWIAATSTVVGAICADRRSAGEIGAAPPRATGTDGSGPLAPPGVFATAAWRALLAVSAAIGALLSVALVLVPAREAVRPDTSTPQLIAAGYAFVGITVGIIIAVCVLVARAAATNVIITSGWLWILAVAAVVDGAASGRGLATEPLGVWPFGDDTYFRATWSLEGAALMLSTALLIGAGAAWLASRRSDSRIGVALSGAVGPLLVVAAYFLTAPRMVGVKGDPQLSAYLVAPYAVIAGLAGSVLLAAMTASLEANRLAADPDAGPVPAGGFGRITARASRATRSRPPAGSVQPLSEAPSSEASTVDLVPAPKPALTGSKSSPSTPRASAGNPAPAPRAEELPTLDEDAAVTGKPGGKQGGRRR